MRRSKLVPLSIAALAATMTFAACGDDDDDDVETPADTGVTDTVAEMTETTTATS